MGDATAPLVAELDHIRKVYGSGDTAVTALDDLCLNVRTGPTGLDNFLRDALCVALALEKGDGDVRTD